MEEVFQDAEEQLLRKLQDALDKRFPGSNIKVSHRSNKTIWRFTGRWKIVRMPETTILVDGVSDRQSPEAVEEIIRNRLGEVVRDLQLGNRLYVLKIVKVEEKEREVNTK